MYRLWIRSLYWLHGPRCLLFKKAVKLNHSPSFHGLSIANVPCITSGISRWAISSISDQFYSFTQRSKSLQQIEWQWTVMSKCPGWQHHWDYENVHKNSGRIIGHNDVAMSTSLSISMTTQKLNYLHLKSYRERLGIKLRFTIYWGYTKVQITN